MRYAQARYWMPRDTVEWQAWMYEESLERDREG
jgi:hypothetical protein